MGIYGLYRQEALQGIERWWRQDWCSFHLPGTTKNTYSTRAGSTSSSWAHAAFCRLPGQKLPFSYCYLAITYSTNSFLLGFLKRRFAKKLPSSILQELLAKDHGLIVARNHLIDFRHSSGSVGQQLQSSIFRWHVHSIKLKRHSQSVDMPLQLDAIATGKQQLQAVEPWDEMLQEAWVKEGIFPTWLSNNVSMPGRIPARSRAGKQGNLPVSVAPFWVESKANQPRYWRTSVLGKPEYPDAKSFSLSRSSAESTGFAQLLELFILYTSIHVPCTWMYYNCFKNMPKLQENDIRNICMGSASLATSLSWRLDASLGFQLYLLLDRSKLRSDAVKKLRRLRNGECSGLNFPMLSQPNKKITTQKSQPSVSCTTVRKDCKVMLPASENCIPPKVLWGLLWMRTLPGVLQHSTSKTTCISLLTGQGSAEDESFENNDVTTCEENYSAKDLTFARRQIWPVLVHQLFPLSTILVLFICNKSFYLVGPTPSSRTRSKKTHSKQVPGT